jgi:hypothetical protein
MLDNYHSSFVGFFSENDVTEVKEVREIKEIKDKSWYTLDGRKVANPMQGLYIVNGRKVVVR